MSESRLPPEAPANGHAAAPVLQEFTPVLLEIVFEDLVGMLDGVCRPRGPSQDGGYPLNGLAEHVEEYVRDYTRAVHFHRKVLRAREQFRYHGRAVLAIENALEVNRLALMLSGTAIPAIRRDGSFAPPETLRAYALLETEIQNVLKVARARLEAATVAKATPRPTEATAPPPAPPPPPEPLVKPDAIPPAPTAVEVPA